MIKNAASGGRSASIAPMPRSSVCQNSISRGRRAASSRLTAPGRPVRQVPDVPQLVLEAVGGHQVENEQVPVAPVHQELDGLEVLVQEVVKVGEHGGLVAAVVDGRRPGSIRADHLAPARRRVPGRC